MTRQRKLVASTNTVVVADYYLPDECWEHVFKSLNNGYENRYLNSLSVVSKQFLSITNRLLRLIKPTDTFIHCVFRRFTNLTFLDLSDYNGDIDKLLCEISCFPLNITSLDISNQTTIPTIGLRAFSKNITTLTSLTCYNMDSINSPDLFLIAECFPLLEKLDLCHPSNFKNRSSSFLDEPLKKFLNGVETLSLALFNLTKIDLSGHDYINDTSVFNLFKNCKLLQEVIMFDCYRLTKAGIASALCERPTLRSLSFTNYFESRNFAMLYELVRNYPSLSEIRMKYAFLEENSIDDSNSLMNFVVRPQLKSLGLSCNSWLGDKNIKMFALIFPNLQMLDLNHCYNISEEGIFHVLRICGNIRHLNLASSEVTLEGLNFEVPNLEVLNLSCTFVDDATLYVISKNCCGLLQLLLKNCHVVTQKGVMHVVENCTQLREINLRYCYQVRANTVDDMVFSRPSLRKIIAPPFFDLSCKKMELFSRYGCLVCF